MGIDFEELSFKKQQITLLEQISHNLIVQNVGFEQWFDKIVEELKEINQHLGSIDVEITNLNNK